MPLPIVDLDQATGYKVLRVGGDGRGGVYRLPAHASRLNAGGDVSIIVFCDLGVDDFHKGRIVVAAWPRLTIEARVGRQSRPVDQRHKQLDRRVQLDPTPVACPELVG